MSSLQALSTVMTAHAPSTILEWVSGARKSSLRRNIIIGSASSIGSAFIALISYPIYLRYLGYDSYGLWLAMSSVVSLSQLGCSGVTAAVAKLVAEEYNHGRFNEAVTFVVTTTVLVFGLSFLFALGVWTCGPLIPGALRLTPAQALVFQNLLPFVLAFSVYSLCVEVSNASLLGMGALERLGYIQIGTQALSICIATILLQRRFGLASLLIAGFAGTLGQHVAGLGLIKTLLPRGTRFDRSYFDREQLRRFSAFGGWMAGASLVNLLISPLNRFILARWCGIASIPIYEIAFSGSMRLRSTMEAGLRALMPAVSGTLPGKLRRVGQLHRSALKTVVLVSFPVYTALWLSAPQWLSLWLRGRFNPLLVPATRIMLIGAFASLICIPAYYLLLGLGKPRDCFVGQCLHGTVAFLMVVFILVFRLPLTVGTVCLAAACGMIATAMFLINRLNEAVHDVFHV